MWIHQRSGFKGLKSRNAISGLGFRVWILALLTHLRDALRVDTSGGTRGGSGVEAGEGASAARSEARVHQTLRARWGVGGMGTWVDRCSA